MATRRRPIPVAFILGLALLTASTSAATACPFCGPPSITWSERLERADFVVLVQWSSAIERDGKTAAKTNFSVQQVTRGSKQLTSTLAVSEKSLKGTSISIDDYYPGRKGELFLLTGNNDPDAKEKKNSIAWDRPKEVNEISFNYIVQAPSADVAFAKRLPYFLKFLEFPDPLISADAFAEFGKAPYKDVTALSSKMSREKVRGWLANNETPKTRLGLYGLMIGLCGNNSDRKWLEGEIGKHVKGFRFGLDGMLAGYLLLAGKDGIDWIEKNIIESAKVPEGDAYAAMQALRFLWNYDKQRFGAARLKRVMRKLLPKPRLTELVIRDLARWKDWELQDQLMKSYGTKGYDSPPVKRAIVQYLLKSTKDRGGSTDKEEPAHVVRGKKHLEVIQKKDPVIVKQAKRFLF